MAHTGLWATSDEILCKAGEDYATTFTEARINAACKRVEAAVNCITRHNWSDEFSAVQTPVDLNEDFWYILAEIEACWVAIEIITYSMQSHSGGMRAAETQIDWLKHTRDQLLETLKDKTGVQTFMGVI